MGTEKNRLDEAVLLSTQNMFKLMVKKIITFSCSKNMLIWTYEKYFPTYLIILDFDLAWNTLFFAKYQYLS